LSLLEARPRVHKWFNLMDKNCQKRVKGQVNLKICFAPLPQYNLKADWRFHRANFDATRT